MYRILAVLALFLTSSASANSPARSLEEFIDAEMAASGALGLAYATARDGVIESGERGVQIVGRNDGVAPATPFLIGSVSKSFTALAVMQLVEAGQIKLDAPISTYLPAFEGRSAAAITVRQLLSHTSGYSMLQGNLSQNDFSMAPDALERRVVDAANMGPANEPGATWEYSNTNYQILGRLIEVIREQPYADYVEAKILMPVGMADSFIHDSADTSRMAQGHQPWFGSKRALAENMTGLGSAPQGGVVASARDMARYLAMMMNGEDDVLSAESKVLMMSPASEVSPNYGFGWFINSEEGTVFHSGSNPGYDALATMVPAEQKGIAVLINAGSGIGFGVLDELRFGLTARAIGLQYEGQPSALPQKLTFIGLAALPVFFLFSIIWAWFKREKIREKPGLLGQFSLWFPLLTTAGYAWLVFFMVPILFGAPLSAISAFQPDVALALIAGATTGLAWAIWRIGLANTGGARQRPN